MAFEKQLKRISKIKEDDKREKLAFALSSLPPMAMLKKLLTRKNGGKKPFSNEFDFEGRMKEIDETISFIDSQLSDKEIDYSLIKSKLLEVSKTAMLASEEIRMASLKNDFIWIFKTIEDDSNHL